MVERPEEIACFGVYCWHDYSSNPKTILLEASEDGQHFVQVAELSLELKAGL
jgi:hypothetical protein